VPIEWRHGNRRITDAVVSAILAAKQAIYEAICSLCARACFLDPQRREEAMAQAEGLIYEPDSRRRHRCPDCGRNLDQALRKARRMLAELLNARYSLERQRETFLKHPVGERHVELLIPRVASAD
jgi:hypothetical protein